MLIGRESECARLDELLDRARMGRSATLVLRGEAGIGKTALLGYAAERAADMTVARALGVESEAELEFSGLLDLCRPLDEHIAELPDRQARALRGALGVAAAGPLDRFAVGAATLALLAAAADAKPLLLVVDDAQWLDRSSADALLFATRRLQADRVLALFGAREGEETSFEAPGIPSVTLAGLPREAAADLLRSHVEIADEVAAPLYEATRGNPLALIELPGMLSPEQLAGTMPLQDPLPAGGGVERAFARRAGELTSDSRRALLVAAASVTGAMKTILAALDALGLAAASLEPAEDAGLIRIADEELEFRHPLVRSAVHHAADPSDRRAAHRALADALAASPHAAARAWHLAAAAFGPDEEAAAALEQAAEQARLRNGYASAAAGLERAARITPDPDAARGRLAAAADAAWHAGRAVAAERLLTEALDGAGDPRLRAAALRLRGTIEFFAGRGRPAAAALLEALELVDGPEAVAVAADTVNALNRIRKPEQALVLANETRRGTPQDGGETDLEATVALAYALCFNGRYREAEPHLRRAVELSVADRAAPSPLHEARLSAVLGWLGLHEQAYFDLAQAVARARAAGAVGALPHLLSSSAWQAMHAGHFDEAYADAGEALALAEEIGQPATAAQAAGVILWISALRGDDAVTHAHGEEAIRRARELGFRLYELLALLCLALLDLGHGHIDEALGRLEEVARHAQQRVLYIPGVAPRFELAEALVRAGRVAEAEAILDSFEASQLASVPSLSALAERCRGLLADDERFEPHFTEALALHSTVENPFALARTQLAYGERLRRAARRVEAREQLRAALELFERVGAAPWAERARAELRATGETLRRRDRTQTAELTPQELQIALQVAEGKTNKEIGAALFLSHKTIEFHLSRTYRKLDFHSRAELIRHFARATPATSAPATSY